MGTFYTAVNNSLPTSPVSHPEMLIPLFCSMALWCYSTATWSQNRRKDHVGQITFPFLSLLDQVGCSSIWEPSSGHLWPCQTPSMLLWQLLPGHRDERANMMLFIFSERGEMLSVKLTTEQIGPFLVSAEGDVNVLTPEKSFSIVERNSIPHPGFGAAVIS